MKGASDNADLTVQEREILRHLCCTSQAAREAGLRRLASYRFSLPLHQVIYGALCELASANSTLAPHALSARLTLRGFPDVDTDALFQPAENPEALEALIARVTALR